MAILRRMVRCSTFVRWTLVQRPSSSSRECQHFLNPLEVTVPKRRVLLASSSDETTTFIILPDFDLEAMSSVLYYIYNGEVVLQKSKLGLFLEIVRTMQIYIDSQYISKIQENADGKVFGLEKNIESISLHSEIFTLGLIKDADQHILNIKKCKESQVELLKYSHSDIDFGDNALRYLNESELGESRLGNLKSPYGSRQRNSLLRDLYIEAYPPNGNVNGLTESVLAISNECYQSPASVLLANANCRHLCTDDAHTRKSKKVNGHTIISSADTEEGRIRSSYNCSDKECGEVPLRDTTDSLRRHKYSANMRKATLIYGKSESFLGDNRFIPINPTQILLDERNKNASFDVSKSVLEPMEYRTNKSSDNPFVDVTKYDSMRKKHGIKSTNSAKVIFNHVLENPWNARKPNNYRPFRRKEKNESDTLTSKKEDKNDTNNNIRKSPLLPEEITPERIVVKEQELIDSPLAFENRECFKCSHCDQVFTSDESLAVHMKRHSSNARYTCGECEKTFSQLRNFKYHMSIHRGTREFAATCTVCGKYFNDRGYLSSHMKIHRNRKEYKCSLCPKSFNQRVAYNMHVRIHTGVKPHVCDECGKAFSRKMLLKQHQRTHSGERPYACSHCDKRFADRSNMTLHLRLHTGVKPFSCPMCPKSFTKKHHLKSHLNFHTGSKPYSCPRCSLAFTQSSNMRTHYKKCTAPEPSTSHETQSGLAPLYLKQ